MDQLCEPIEVNRRFIKILETIIKPQYEKQLNDIFSLLQKDIDTKYKIKTHRQINSTYLEKCT